MGKEDEGESVLRAAKRRQQTGPEGGAGGPRQEEGVGGRPEEA